MIKRLLCSYSFACDRIAQILLGWCGYDYHKANTRRLGRIYDELTKLEDPVPFYGGPRDGGQMFYAGLVYRLAAHREGAYCFDGCVYRWIAGGCEQGVNNL